MGEYEIFAAAYRQSKDPGSNPGTVGSVSFSTEKFQIRKIKKIYLPNSKFGKVENAEVFFLQIQGFFQCFEGM